MKPVILLYFLSFNIPLFSCRVMDNNECYLNLNFVRITICVFLFRLRHLGINFSKKVYKKEVHMCYFIWDQFCECYLILLECFFFIKCFVQILRVESINYILLSRNQNWKQTNKDFGRVFTTQIIFSLISGSIC